MKTIRLILIACLSLAGFKNANSQTYSIPWAQQQPAWVFPLWFESGDDKKDTVYLVYDPLIDDDIDISDTLFGITQFCHSADSFHIYFVDIGTCGVDSISFYKVFPAFPGGIAISIRNAKYPFKMKWDRQLFYDTVLLGTGFPDNRRVRLPGSPGSGTIIIRRSSPTGSKHTL